MNKQLKRFLDLNRSKVRAVAASIQQWKDRSEYMVLVLEKGSVEAQRLEDDMGGGPEEGLFGEVVICAVKRRNAGRILRLKSQAVNRWLAKADDRLPLTVATKADCCLEYLEWGR